MENNRLEIIRAVSIDSNDMNKQLSSIYQANWDHCCKTIDDCKAEGYELANIYLVATSEEYFKAKTKVMCLGKETQCWGGEFIDAPTIEELMQLYTLYTYSERGNKAAFHRFVNWISSLSPDVAVIPNNVIKIGKKYKNSYYKVVADKLHEQVNLLKEEISILIPSIIICPTSNLEAYNQPMAELLGNYTESIIQQDLFVSERRYEVFSNIPFIMCPHPQGKKRVKLDQVKEIISRYILA